MKEPGWGVIILGTLDGRGISEKLRFQQLQIAAIQIPPRARCWNARSLMLVCYEWTHENRWEGSAAKASQVPVDHQEGSARVTTS